jgi:excinuclease ABC subunit C
MLKDDKHYPYIKVTMNEDYPRVLMTRKLEKDGAKYFGPYSSAFAVKDTIELIKKLFPIKSCSKVLPRDIGKDRPCLNYHIFQCLGPCQGHVNKEEYRDLMKDICSFLGGKHEEIIARLERQMKDASEKLNFEKAANLRDKINSLKHIAEKQKVLSTTMEDQDVVAFARGQTDSCVQVFFIRGGKLIGREHFIFEGAGDTDNKELMTSFIKQFYNATSYIPGEILLQEDIDELNIIEKWLSEKREARVYIKSPQEREKLHLIEYGIAECPYYFKSVCRQNKKGRDC